jgi:glutaredoxin 3
MNDDTKTEPNVVIYSSPTCGYCHMAKEYFNKLHVPFVEKDITVDEAAYHFVVDNVGQAVTPIITVGKTIIIGFDRPKIDEAVAKLTKSTAQKDRAA